MFKKFLYFTRGQQIGIIILLVLVVGLVLFNILLPKLIPAPILDNDSTFRSQVAAFEKTLENLPRNSYQSPFEKTSYQQFERKKTKAELFTFDPNTLDSANLVRLGLKPYVAKNIINYRLKGGKFKTAEDFSKIYGISADEFETLKPYIHITIKEDENREKTTKKSTEPMYVELNSSDTTLLKQLRGVGSGRAKQIVSYREQLGGFSTKEQLLEIKNFPEEVYLELMPYVSVQKDSIKPILVNKATVDRLKKHPYINFYQAKAIYELRRTKEGLKSIEELKALPEFTSEQLQKLAPYLDFKEIRYEYKRR
ncbi:MAG TPA: helix-hairpin-helix domain-containing protein [Paludibacteraceae bacterium]|nr:helix-hairpin-helix domain-containing protein [Paludibacteraceae bacterium]